MTSPSSFFPEVFDLSNGPVQSVITSQTDPRVVYDHNGFRATDVNGALVFSLDAVAGTGQFTGHVKAAGVDMPVSAGPLTLDNVARVRWGRSSDQANMGNIGALPLAANIDSSQIQVVSNSYNSQSARTDMVARTMPGAPVAGEPSGALDSWSEIQLNTALTGSPPEIRLIVGSAAQNQPQKILYDGSGKSDFLGAIASNRWALGKQVSLGFNVPNGADTDGNVTIPATNGVVAVQVFDWIDSTPGFQYPQALNRAYEFTSNTNLRVHMSNRLGTGLSAIGTLRIMVLYLYTNN